MDKTDSWQRLTKVCILAGALAVASVIVARLPAWAQVGLRGPRYYADIQLMNGSEPLPPLGHTQRMEVDTGAPLTLLTRAAATSFTLLQADGSDNGYHAGDIRIGGVGGGGIAAQYSTLLSILAKGKRADGTDAQPNFVRVNNLRIVYPKKDEGDLDNLLGTNYITNLGVGGRFIANADGSCTFVPAPPPRPPIRRTGLQLRGLIPPADGFGDQFIVPGLQINAISADFILTTGSPYTIISTKLAAALKLSPMGSYDLYNGDPETFATLVNDGFFDNYNPGPLAVFMVSQLKIPTDDGSGITLSNVPVLVNPFSTPDNVFGTNLLNPGNMATEVDLFDGYLQYDVYPSPSPGPTPTPSPTPKSAPPHQP
jgi:hypothetical protein